LRRVGLLGSDTEDVDEVVLALHRYLGRTPSRLLALSLADAVGEVRTQNQPGTTDEYPNWRVPLGDPKDHAHALGSREGQVVSGHLLRRRSVHIARTGLVKE